MERIPHILQVVTMGISIVGVIVVLWGIIESAVAFLMMKVAPAGKNPISESESIRQKLGAHLLLGLEIFIAADIISSVASPTWERVGILASIVGVRTVLSYFLRMEIKQKAD